MAYRFILATEISTLNLRQDFYSYSKRLLCLLLLMFINGCVKQQTVAEHYPLWGKTVTLTSSGSRARHLQIKEPEQGNAAKACILMVHGMNEHIGRYAEIAHYFSDQFIVAGIDLTAHGLSNPIFAKIQKKAQSQQ